MDYGLVSNQKELVLAESNKKEEDHDHEGVSGPVVLYKVGRWMFIFLGGSAKAKEKAPFSIRLWNESAQRICCLGRWLRFLAEALAKLSLLPKPMCMS